MRIKSVEITNFKCIKSTQKIELRPITLLFGANSAGKSTVLHALHYLREIIERENLDPDFTIGGGQLDLGGFRSLIHNHELSDMITLKLTFDLSNVIENEFIPLSSGDYFYSKEFQNLGISYLAGDSVEFQNVSEISEVGLELSVCWDKDNQIPYIKRTTTEINGQRIASIVANIIDDTAQITNINFSHPVLSYALPKNDSNADATSLGNSTIEREIKFHLPTEISGSIDLNSEGNGINLKGNSALPPMDEMLDLIDLEEIHDESHRKNGLCRLFSELMLGPVKIAKHCLEQITFIGPVRDIPIRNLKPQRISEESRWASGLGAWDLLYNDSDGKLIESVNKWLEDKELLNTSYIIDRYDYKEIRELEEIDSLMGDANCSTIPDEIKAKYQKLPSYTEIQLMDKKNNIYVKPGDVGVGISQLLPIVVSSLCKRSEILIIEQPELHLNPKLQVCLGDLFIYSISKNLSELTGNKTLIIETHSEHILLRLLRRVREYYANDLPDNMIGLPHGKLSIYYVENTNKMAEFRYLEVDEEGEFDDCFPDGFFEERAKELF